MTDKLKGTCSVCLQEQQLKSDKPIRHGFHARNVKHGSHGGWHTGACPGTGFPHLGISVEGTVWALGDARRKIDAVDEELARLATKPDLTWHPTIKGKPDLKNAVTLQYGHDVKYAADGRPSYNWEWERRVQAQKHRKQDLEEMIKRYEDVIANWQPQAATTAAEKKETVHSLLKRTDPRAGAFDGILCRRTRPGFANAKLLKTDDITKVTCKSCLSKLGLL